jgi:isoleucyl-tRNA synthetase
MGVFLPSGHCKRRLQLPPTDHKYEVSVFRPVSTKFNVTLIEEDVLRFWRSHRIIEKSFTRNLGSAEYVFYEGPPTANGLPGVHHVLARAFKDVFPRFKSMRGFHVIRRGGWDTHGLPVELEVEKRLGFTNKGQIEDYGIAAFNELCRKSAFEYIQDWERLTERIAFWVDLEDAYVTYTNEYIESVWWILKELWDKGLLYKGHKVVPYCPRCGTPLSDHEVALGYDQAVDPSLFVRLPLVKDPGTSLLIWTTTPWTLPGNVAVAAHPDVEYVIVEREMAEGGTERLILAKPLVEQVFRDETVQIYETFKGTRLKGLRYQPLFTFLVPKESAHYVINEDFVTTDDGTGLVHIAPAFGAEDLQAAKQRNLPILMTVNDQGAFVQEVRPWRGMFVKDADRLIVQDLDARGLLFRSETYTHTYPFCWRCDTPLLYYARSSWYIRTTQYKDRMVALNQRINWYPEHIKDGRFGNWLENNVDWALGRERYWGTPLPIWECSNCQHHLAFGSIAELSELAGQDISDQDLHRPYVDEVRFLCPECGNESGTHMRRVPELIDVWFDSGAMPVAQWHYPFENQDMFKQQFPADFICEAVDQTRGWFYSLHAISSMLFESESFKNVICLGLVLDSDGQKMSKSRGKVIDPWEVINEHGADAFRWYLYTASPPGQERRFSKELVGEVIRGFTLTLWNVYAFFVTYANLDEWLPGDHPSIVDSPETSVSYNDLDHWLRSELHALVRDVTAALEKYNILGATRPVQTFIDNLSKWYLRRSRRRFWKSETDDDKHAAYATLYEALTTLCRLLAPTSPFIAEEIFQNLVRLGMPTSAESVHLSEWPSFNPNLINEELNQDMRLVMKLASLGHAARNQVGIKVRQPLSRIAFSVSNKDELEALEQFTDLLADELNVKQVNALGSAGEAVSYSLKPLPRQLGQKYQNLFPKVSLVIGELDAENAARQLLDGRSIQVQVEGSTFEILPEEVEVRAEARAGLVVASEGAYLAALTTELTPELTREGLARELVRRVQDLRKKIGLDIADRIRLYIQATPELHAAVEAHREYIMGETLAVAMEEYRAASGEGEVMTVEFDDQQADLRVEKAN